MLESTQEQWKSLQVSKNCLQQISCWLLVKNPLTVIGPTRFFYCLIQLAILHIHRGDRPIGIWGWSFLSQE